MAQADIVVEDVHKAYGDVKALSGVSLTVAPGTILGLLGPNGAGKTTLVRILTTLLIPDAGSARVAGYDVVQDAQSVREIMGLAGQYAAIDENLTGHENLTMVGRLYHLSRAEAKQRAAELLAYFQLDDASSRLAKTYSGGMRRRLDLAASLVARPKVLFLDEPTAGLDPASRIGLWKIIKSLVSGGTTVLLTTQYLEEADRLTDRIAVIDHGRLVAQGTARELKSQVGGDVIELHVVTPTDAPRAAAGIAALGSHTPEVDTDAGRVTMSVTGGTNVLVETVRRLDQAGITLADIVLRQPSLDEVFLSLTGHTTSV